MKEIKFYKTQTGKIPVKEFLDSLPSKHAQKVTWVLELIEKLEQIPVQYFKKLKNTDDPDFSGGSSGTDWFKQFSFAGFYR